MTAPAQPRPADTAAPAAHPVPPPPSTARGDAATPAAPGRSPGAVAAEPASDVPGRPDASGQAAVGGRSAVVAGPPAGAVEPGLDRPVRLIGRRLWLAAAALLLAAGAGTAWGVAGSLPHTATLHGVLAHGRAPLVTRAAAPGSVLRVLVAPGARVARGQTLAVLATSGGAPGATSELTAPQDGTVTALLAVPGASVVPGTGVVALDPASAPATVRLFVTSAGRMRQLRLGQPVVVDLPAGPVRLRITSADPYPAPAATLAGTLPVPVPGVPSGDTPVWTVYAEPAPGAGGPDSGAARALSAAAAVPGALDASVDLGARHPYQALLDATGAGR